MLYLEDFIELIENLPQEFTEKLIAVGDLDRSVESSQAKIDDDISTLFSCAKRLKNTEKEASHQTILKKFSHLLEEAQEKVTLTVGMVATLQRYIKKIEQESEKFKCELEADSPGITEILEKKSLEMDEPLNQKENRNSNSRSQTNTVGNSEWRNQTAIKKEEADYNLSSNLSLSPQASMSYLGMNSGDNVIAAAASQAIAATQQIRQGRKAASFLSTFDSGSHGVFPSEFSMGSELAHAAKAALAASSLANEPSTPTSPSISTTHIPKRQKKAPRTPSSSISGQDGTPSPSDLPPDTVVEAVVDNPEWTFDPNEPRYCICNCVSYGDMVACDNPKCPLEWFHYPCVGITANPKGKWYCPPCTGAMNKRQQRK